MQDALDPVLMLMQATLVTFFVDMFPKAEPWMKVILSVASALALTFGSGVDVVANVAGHTSTTLSMVVSSLILAAIASKAVHPVKEAVRSISKG